MDENGHDDKQLHVSVEALSLARPNTLDLNGHVESENLLSVCSTTSSKSDFSVSSFSSNDFTALRAKEGMDLDMGQLDMAAEIFDHSDIDIEETGLADRSLSLSSRYWSCDPSVGVTIRMTSEGPSPLEQLTVIEMLQKIVKHYGDCLALAVKRFGMWRKWTYEEYYHNCMSAAKAFIKLGLEPHHSVCIIGFNAPEWHISLIGAIMAGGMGVGLYLTCTPEGCQHIASTSKANIIVVENDSQLEKVLEIKDKLPHLKAIIHYSDLLVRSTEENLFHWNDMIAMDTKDYDEELEKRMKALAPNKCCSILYTSGTTGKPKGVMLSHDNCLWASRKFMQHASCVMGQERVISYLPLGHVSPQLLDVYVMIATAGACWFAQPNAMKGSLIETLKEVHPTLFLGVPRVWDKIAEGMQLVSRNISGIKGWIRDWARGIGLKGNFHKQSGGSGTPLGWTLANAMVFNKVRKLLGLDQCHFPMTGSAPISQDTLAYFMSVNIPIYELYGMSECCGCCTVTTGDIIRFKSTGIPLPGAELRVSNVEGSDSGELQIRGRCLMMGYLDDPESTLKAFTSDGYLKSGDIGYISEEGFIYITGRMKEMIVTATGENVAPVPIESLIKEDMPIISNVVLIGDHMEYLVCLITLKVEFDHESGLPTDKLNETARAVCGSMNVRATTVSDINSTKDGEKVLKLIQSAIDRANEKATAKHHKIVKWSILSRDFSVATGELSSTLKLKRKMIAERYSHVIESLYSDDHGTH